MGMLYAMFVMNKNDLISSIDELYSCVGGLSWVIEGELNCIDGGLKVFSSRADRFANQ